MDAYSPHRFPGEFESPTILQLTLGVSHVSPEAQVADILEMFRSSSDLSLLPVIGENGEFFAAISRRSFLNFMTQSYTLELFSRKTVEALFQLKPEIGEVPMLVQSGARVDQAMREYLRCDPEMKHEALPVLDRNRFVGIVTLTDMMMSLTESQEKLIDVMQDLSARLNEEVAHAAILQRNLLPNSEISLPGVRGMATLVTSSEVGGDFYDYYVVNDRWVVMLIGDVSGHGVASGTLVSAAKAGVNLLSDEGERNPGVILNRLNQALLKIGNQRLLMTMFAAALDTCTGELLYANAGHQFPYFFSREAGEMLPLEAGGLPLGKSGSTTYPAIEMHMGLGDRLFMYTDGLLEEVDQEGQEFGYDRLEEYLAGHFTVEPAVIAESLLDSLRSFVCGKKFEDDVTVFCVEHHERLQGVPQETAEEDAPGLVRIAESFYRKKTDRLMPRISRQHVIFLAEDSFADLLPRMARDGIRRVLPRRDATVQRLGWKTLLSQHEDHQGGDLERFLQKGVREFRLEHSADKDFLIQEAAAWLEESGLVCEERMDAIVILMDELIENGLYAAPRDGKGRALYAKGTERILASNECLKFSIGISSGFVGLQVTDDWGTLTPAVFLNRLVAHSEGNGLIAGEGGAGLYIIWKLSDYLQIRVHPRHRTQVTVLLDLTAPFSPEEGKGFQFIYHNDIHENLENESNSIPSYA